MRLTIVYCIVAIIFMPLSLLVGIDQETRYDYLIVDNKHETVFTYPVEAGDRFVIEYTHSVEKTTVKETYVVEESGGIVQVKTSYTGWGVGLADPYNHPGQYYYDLDDKMLHIELNRPISLIRQRTSALTNHTLIIDNCKVLLHELAGPDQEVVLLIIRVEAVE